MAKDEIQVNHGMNILKQISSISIKTLIHRWKYILKKVVSVFNKTKKIPDQFVDLLQGKELDLRSEALKKDNSKALFVLNQMHNIWRRCGIFIQQFEQNRQKSELELKKLEIQINHITTKDVPLQNPRHLCCSFCFFEGRLNYENLQHEFVSIPMLENSKVVSRLDLQNAICGSLNYRRDLVIIIGLNKHLEVIGTKYSPNLKEQFEELFWKAVSESIRPSIDRISQMFEIKYVPILKRESKAETGNCLITITVKRGKKSAYFIRIPRNGLHQKHYFFYGKKTSKIPLKVEECKGENIYHQLHRPHIEKYRKRKIHQGPCQKERKIVEIDNNLQIADEETFFQFDPNTLFEYLATKQQYTDCTVVKFTSSSSHFQHQFIMKNIEGELERQRQAFCIKPIKVEAAESEENVQACKKMVFVLIIFHDYHPQIIKNILGSFNSSRQFFYTTVTSCLKIKQFADNAGLEKLRKVDRRFMKHCPKQLPNEALSRMYTISNKNTRQVYYHIKAKSERQELWICCLVFIINTKLDLSPQFVKQNKSDGPFYKLPWKLS